MLDGECLVAQHAGERREDGRLVVHEENFFNHAVPRVRCRARPIAAARPSGPGGPGSGRRVIRPDDPRFRRRSMRCAMTLAACTAVSAENSTAPLSDGRWCHAYGGDDRLGQAPQPQQVGAHFRVARAERLALDLPDRVGRRRTLRAAHRCIRRRARRRGPACRHRGACPPSPPPPAAAARRRLFVRDRRAQRLTSAEWRVSASTSYQQWPSRRSSGRTPPSTGSVR